MKKHFNLIFFVCILFFTFFLSEIVNAQTGEWKIALEIKRWFLTIAGSWTTNIWTIWSNPENEERTISMDNVLQTRDTSWFCGWHYTTLQIWDLKNWSYVLPKENISVNISSKTNIAGTENSSISVWPTISNIRWSVKNPTTHLFRAIWTDCWKIWQYSTTWEIKINIPANQSAGTYRGKIYFLLIDNN